MFNKSEIMNQAWAIYRRIHATYADWQFERGIHDGSFSGALKQAWRSVKRAAAEAALKVLEALIPEARAIRAEIDALKYKGFAHNIHRELVALEEELAAILFKAAPALFAGRA